jgi:hypothetical protein
MKSVLAAVFFLATSILPTFAEEPTIREAKEWIIISGTGFEQSGPLPWTHAIRKDLILSVTIQPSASLIYPEGKGPMKFHDTPKDDISKLAAAIEITTSESPPDSRGSFNKRYTIEGFTNATAPAFLDKILELIQKPGK